MPSVSAVQQTVVESPSAMSHDSSKLRDEMRISTHSASANTSHPSTTKRSRRRRTCRGGASMPPDAVAGRLTDGGSVRRAVPTSSVDSRTRVADAPAFRDETILRGAKRRGEGQAVRSRLRPSAAEGERQRRRADAERARSEEGPVVAPVLTRSAPAIIAIDAAPSWCPPPIQPNTIGARVRPNASFASRSVGGTVAIQSRPYQTANANSDGDVPASAKGRKSSDSPRNP